MRRGGWSRGFAAVLVTLACSFAAAAGPPAAAANGPAGPGSWTVYHADAAGSGVAPGVRSVNTGRRAWTSPALDGQIYGEPLVFAGRVYIATESDTVYALSAGTGAVLWSRHLGSPVPARSLPCGDIRPTVGITGTPVIDPSSGEVFAVADELVHGNPAHVLVGLATASGQIEMTRDVDPAGADPAALLQRTGLTLDGGQVVFGMGGNYGDCASYRGRVIAVPETGGRPRMFTVDGGAGQSEGAVWMGGAAPVIDGSGDIWAATGNGSVHSASQGYDDSDSLLELSPTLRLRQFFAPRDWAQRNAQDLDMSAAPALLADGQVILAGKGGVAYLLNRDRLGGIGGQQAGLGSACGGDDIDGGIAISGTTVYLPCVDGVIAVRATDSPPALRVLWSSGTGGGPPIIAAGLIWTIGQNGTLTGLDPATGGVRQQASIGAVGNHFPTPSVADGLLLAPAGRDVVAFPASASAPPASAPGPVPAASGGGGGLAPAAVAGIVAAGLVAIGGAGWLAWRRRTGH